MRSLSKEIGLDDSHVLTERLSCHDHGGVTHTANTTTKFILSAGRKASESCGLLTREELEGSGGSSMDYNWLATHDPITIDANLAEIDFDDFKNEDIHNAYAYSLQSYDDASSSGTDMSICRSEALFSSYKEPPGGAESLIQDSLTAEDFHYCGEGLAVNKNNYTLTFSHNQSESINIQAAHHADFTRTHGGSLPDKDDISDKFTTWSNMVRQKDGAISTDHRGRIKTKEENNINNNMDNSRKSRSLPNISKDKPPIKHAWKGTDEEEEKFQREILSDEPSLIALYLQQRGGDRNSWGGIGHYDGQSSHESSYSEECGATGDRANEQKLLHGMKNKDMVNNFLKTASKLTSIEEASELSSLGPHSSADDSSDAPSTLRQPVPTPRRAVAGSSSRSSMSTTPSLNSNFTNSRGLEIGPLQTKASDTSQGNARLSSAGSSKSSGNLPTLDFLENDVGLWDAFFMHSKNSSKFPGVLTPALPVDEYLAAGASRSGGGKQEIRDLSSLRVLLPNSQKHLIPSNSESGKASPIRQVCTSLSQLNCSSKQQQARELKNKQNLVIKSASSKKSQQQHPTVVQVKEAWVPGPEKVQGYVPDWESYQRQSEKTSKMLRMREQDDSKLNLLNNNKSSQEEKTSKRRSYHPQDFLSKVLTSPGSLEEKTLKKNCQKLQRSNGFPKSGSYGNLCDSWQDPPSSPLTPTATVSGAIGGHTPGKESSSSSEGQKKCSTGSAHAAIKNLPAEYPFQANLCLPTQSINFDLTHKRGLFVTLYASVERLLLYQDTSKAASRCILLHEFCPALHTILEDGLKEEVITSFGRMKTSVWRVIEAVMQAGPAQRNTCDLVMLLNTKFSSEEDFKKFSGFVIGLLNMSCLHIWFSKLKWSLDVLLRFYERHAFICALHKETKLLFDELNFCLQRLYSIPFHMDMPFNDSILEEITSAEVYKKREHCESCACTRTPTSGSEASSCMNSAGSRPASTDSSRTSRGSKSRIPRPISLPKRLEDKLSVRATSRGSPQRASSAGVGGSSSRQTPVTPEVKKTLKSPGTKPAIPPRPKSRVRDTVKLFDAKSNKTFRGRSELVGGHVNSPGTSGGRSARKPVKAVTSPKTGGGEAMVDLDSGGDPFR